MIKAENEKERPSPSLTLSIFHFIFLLARPLRPSATAYPEYVYLTSSLTVFKIRNSLPFQVGNQDFANYVDGNLDLTHINNKKDPIPIVPGMFLGFVHPAGEIHIQASGTWDSCPGQDNPSDLCIVGDVPNIFDGDESDHDGPYNGVEMGC